MSRKRIARRDFLKLTGLGIAGSALTAACGPQTPTSVATAGPTATTVAATAEPTAAKPVTITMVESWFGLPQYKEVLDPVNQAVSQKMQSEGLNIEIQSMILDDHQNKYPLLYSSGNNFTMAFDAPWYKMDTLRDQKAITPLEGLIQEYGPKIVEGVTQKIYEFNFAADGHLYGLPVGYYYASTNGAILREDLRKKHNVSEPNPQEGWPGLEAYLQAIKDKESDLIPFINLPGWQLRVGGTRAWQPAGQKVGLIIPDPTQDTQFVDIEAWEPYRQSAELLRSWWEKGLINKTDPASSAATQNVPVDYFFPGKCAAFQENEPDFKYFEFNKQLQAALPEAECKGYDMTGLRAGEKGLGALRQWNFIVVNASAPQEQQVAAIQFWNWLYSSQDNIDLWMMGIEGVNWKKEANQRFSEIPGVDAAKNYRKQWYVAGVPGQFQRLPVDLPKDAEEAVQFYSTASNWVFNPYEKFEIDRKAVETEIAQLEAVFEEATHGMFTGQLPTSDSLKKAKEMLDAAGRQDLKAKLQKQFDDWRANNGM